MRALYRAPSDIQRGADNFIDSQGLGSHRGADDIHHRVHGADFVEVYFFNVAVVDLCLRRPQRFEDGNRGALRARADSRLADDLPYLAQTAPMFMLTWLMRVWLMPVWRGRPRPRAVMSELTVVMLAKLNMFGCMPVTVIMPVLRFLCTILLLEKNLAR